MAHVRRRISTSPGLGPEPVELDYRTVPRVVPPRGELVRAPLDHRQGFVLSLVDGGTSVQSLLDVAGMPESELMSVLHRLLLLGIIALG